MVIKPSVPLLSIINSFNEAECNITLTAFMTLAELKKHNKREVATVFEGPLSTAGQRERKDETSRSRKVSR